MKRAAAACALAAAATGAAAQTLSLGATTQFGQGWPASDWRAVTASSISTVREAVAWRLIEATPGRYGFTQANAGHVARACQAGRKVLLVLTPRHPAYDGGVTVTSAAGRAAFARYVAAVAQRFRGCLTGLEIGNEINAKNAFTGPAASSPIVSYVAILRVLDTVVRPAVPGVVILGGSTNVIATGFLDRLFAAGMLPLVDGIVVHPYRRDPVNVDRELARLRERMTRHGRPVPIWATEFGLPTSDQPAAAAHLVKMATLMSAAGVRHADWYALVDRAPFPTMGLYAADGRAKPAAAALDYMNRTALPRGPAQRVGTDPALQWYRFGADRQIVWGLKRGFAVSGALSFRNVAGRVIPRPPEIGETPFFVEGPGTITPDPATFGADSRYGFGRAPWSYAAGRGVGGGGALGWVDWNWASYVGSPAAPGLVVNQYDMVLPSGWSATTRYAVAQGGALVASACVAPIRPGAVYSVSQNGRVVAGPVAIDRRQAIAVPLSIKAGDVVEFVAAVRGTAPAAIHYRYRLARSAIGAAEC